MVYPTSPQYHNTANTPNDAAVVCDSPNPSTQLPQHHSFANTPNEEAVVCDSSIPSTSLSSPAPLSNNDFDGLHTGSSCLSRSSDDVSLSDYAIDPRSRRSSSERRKKPRLPHRPKHSPPITIPSDNLLQRTKTHDRWKHNNHRPFTYDAQPICNKRQKVICTICQHQVLVGRVLSCGHTFHADCIIKNLREF